MHTPKSALKVRSAEDITRDLRRHSATRKLFDDICEGRPVGRLLMTHRDQLFLHFKEGRVSVALPFLFYDTLPVQFEEHAALAKPVEQASELQRHQSAAFADEITEEFSGLREDFRGAVTLMAIRFVQQNPDVRKLLELETVTMQDVLRAVGGKDLSLGIFTEFGSLLKDEDRAGDDIVLRDKIAKHASALKDFVPTLARNFMSLSNATQLLIPFNLVGREQWRSLLQLLNFSRTEYETLVDDLCGLSLADSTGEIFWCDRAHGQPYIMSSSSSIRPRELNLSCPKCRNPMFASATFVLHDLLDESIRSKDGILGISMYWLLKHKLQVPFESSGFYGDYESDFIVSAGDRRFLIECKMHKRGKDAESVRSRVEAAVVQAVKHAKQLASEGRVVDSAMIVTNLDSEEFEPAMQEVTKSKKKFIGKQRLLMLSFSDFEQAFRRLCASASGE